MPNVRKLLSHDSQIVFRHMEIHPDAFNGIDFDEIGGFTAISAIHTGSLDSIEKTYKLIIKEAKEEGLVLRGDAIERYIVDDCTTKNDELFATEILMPLCE